MKLPRQTYKDVAVAVPVTVPYAKNSDQPVQWWVAKALRALCDGAGIPKERIDGLSLASFTLAPDSPVALAQHLGLSLRWIDGIAMGGASSIVGLRRAARAVQSGDAHIIACIGADINKPGAFRDLVTSFSRFSQDASYPYGAGGPNASFALLTDYYMRTYGATAQDFGKLAVSQRQNAASNPHALLRSPMSMEDYLDSRPIADPLRLYDCVMPCSGSEAFLVMHEQTAKDLGLPYAQLLAAIERHNAFRQDEIQTRGGWQVDVDQLWGMSGLGHADIDVVQTYDDYPVISMLQFEDLGFCAKGEGPEFVREHSFTASGTFPHNTSGGQLSTGQAGAAGGHLGTVEALRQVLAQPVGEQVPDARTGLVSGFGMINYDRGLCTAAAIITRGDS